MPAAAASAAIPATVAASVTAAAATTAAAVGLRKCRHRQRQCDQGQAQDDPLFQLLESVHAHRLRQIKVCAI
jgi:hypothetical protein